MKRKDLVLIVLCAILGAAYSNVDCGDGYSCQSGNTCCLLNDGSWGCCPYKNGVCCKETCCTHGTYCSADERTCTTSKNTFRKFKPGTEIWGEVLGIASYSVSSSADEEQQVIDFPGKVQIDNSSEIVLV